MMPEPLEELHLPKVEDAHDNSISTWANQSVESLVDVTRHAARQVSAFTRSLLPSVDIVSKQDPLLNKPERESDSPAAAPDSPLPKSRGSDDAKSPEQRDRREYAEKAMKYFDTKEETKAELDRAGLKIADSLKKGEAIEDLPEKLHPYEQYLMAKYIKERLKGDLFQPAKPGDVVSPKAAMEAVARAIGTDKDRLGTMTAAQATELYKAILPGMPRDQRGLGRPVDPPELGSLGKTDQQQREESRLRAETTVKRFDSNKETKAELDRASLKIAESLKKGEAIEDLPEKLDPYEQYLMAMYIKQRLKADMLQPGKPSEIGTAKAGMEAIARAIGSKDRLGSMTVAQAKALQEATLPGKPRHQR